MTLTDENSEDSKCNNVVDSENNHKMATAHSTKVNKIQTGGIQQMDLTGTNLSDKWINWIMQFNIYMTASGLDAEADTRKVALLLHHIGPAAFPIFKSFNVGIADIDLNTLINKFDSYFIPKKKH